MLTVFVIKIGVICADEGNLMLNFQKLFKNDRNKDVSSRNKKARDRTPRGVVILNSNSTGLLGGKKTELMVNGELQRFDWDKAMLLTAPQESKYD